MWAAECAGVVPGRTWLGELLELPGRTCSPGRAESGRARSAELLVGREPAALLGESEGREADEGLSVDEGFVGVVGFVEGEEDGFFDDAEGEEDGVLGRALGFDEDDGFEEADEGFDDEDGLDGLPSRSQGMHHVPHLIGGHLGQAG